jgi:hypothetical protein
LLISIAFHGIPRKIITGLYHNSMSSMKRRLLLGAFVYVALCTVATSSVCEDEEPFVYDAAEYVPSKSCARYVGETAEVDNACIRELMADLHDLQHERCTRVMTANLMDGGFGSVFHMMILFLQVRSDFDVCPFLACVECAQMVNSIIYARTHTTEGQKAWAGGCMARAHLLLCMRRPRCVLLVV